MSLTKACVPEPARARPSAKLGAPAESDSILLPEESVQPFYTAKVPAMLPEPPSPPVVTTTGFR